VIVIVAGVSGSGKSTVGTLVANMLRWPFADGDSFHSEANLTKMRSGVPLTDEDRAPWLRAIDDWMDAQIAAGQSGVMACSALKRAYRDTLLTGRPSAMMVFLEVSDEILAQRVAARPGHFFPGKLLESQLETLEPPAPDERVRTVIEEGDAMQTAAKVVALVAQYGRPGANEA
jgi:carbohydrate kinase (thermoresistant glucokinase family)